jgi:hypothetical protein
MMTAACLRTIAAAGLSVHTATTAAAAAALSKRCHTTGKSVLLVVVNLQLQVRRAAGYYFLQVMLSHMHL